jgi:hypothetical protein
MQSGEEAGNLLAGEAGVSMAEMAGSSSNFDPK